MDSAILSDQKYMAKFSSAAKTRAVMAPDWPPSKLPTATKTTPRDPRRKTVFRLLVVMMAPSYFGFRAIPGSALWITPDYLPYPV